MFIRFAVIQRDMDSLVPMGVFAAAYDLRDDIDTPPELSARLRALLRWFHDHLDAPDDKPDRRAIFWFRNDARSLIRRAWELSALLHQGGHIVRRVTCERPGKVVWEDTHQVAAIPFRDIRPRL